MYLAWLLLTLYASAYVQDREMYGYGWNLTYSSSIFNINTVAA